MNAWLSFSLTPVQPFLQAARTVRDLKVGSELLSYLVGQAFAAACNAGGKPLYPIRSDSPDRAHDWRHLPNRFVVRYETVTQAQSAAEDVRKAFDTAWYTLARGVKNLLDQQKWPAPWDAGWDEQVQTFWDARVLVVDLTAWSDQDYRDLFGCSADEETPDPLTFGWKVTAAALAAAKTVRRVPLEHGIGRPKCTMMGDLEQMGPGGPVGEQHNWWRSVTGTSYQGIRIGERDRLCAISLVKRFAPAYDGSPLSELRRVIPDTASIATARWREDVLKNENLKPHLIAFDEKAKALADYLGESVGIPARYLLGDNLERDEATGDPELARHLQETAVAREALEDARRKAGLPAPPRYLAIIELDGDHMGRLLGGNGSALTEAHFNRLSSKLRRYGDGAPELVKQHYGEPIYAGGDDVLALAPQIEAIPLALELQGGFPKDLVEDIPSTASVGITIFHYRHDLRDALRHTHRAIERAKNEYGRDCCGISVLKRSGGDLHVVASWDILRALKALAESFASGATDRWLSQLAQMAPGLHPRAHRSAMEALIRRAVERGEGGSKKPEANGTGSQGQQAEDGKGKTEKLTKQVLALWRETWNFLNDPDRRGPTQDTAGFSVQVFEVFLKLVGIASFLARGGE